MEAVPVDGFAAFARRFAMFRRFALDVFLEVVNATYSQAVFGIAYPRQGNITRFDMPELNGFNWILPSIGVRGRF